MGDVMAVISGCHPPFVSHAGHRWDLRSIWILDFTQEDNSGGYITRNLLYFRWSVWSQNRFIACLSTKNGLKAVFFCVCLSVCRIWIYHYIIYWSSIHNLWCTKLIKISWPLHCFCSITPCSYHTIICDTYTMATMGDTTNGITIKCKWNTLNYHNKVNIRVTPL